MKQLQITISAVVLVRCGPRMSIHEAARNGNIEVVKQHLAEGVDMNAKDRHGDTLLYNAVEHGHKEIVVRLITNGADVNAKDEDGEKPLDWAIMFGIDETAALLRKHGGKTGAELKK